MLEFILLSLYALSTLLAYFYLRFDSGRKNSYKTNNDPEDILLALFWFIVIPVALVDLIGDYFYKLGEQNRKVK